MKERQTKARLILCGLAVIGLLMAAGISRHQARILEASSATKGNETRSWFPAAVSKAALAGTPLPLRPGDQSFQQVQDRALLEMLLLDLERVRNDPNLDRASTDLQSLVDSILLADVSTVLGFLLETSDARFPEFRTLLVRRWAANQPSVAADWVTKNLSGAPRAAAMNIVAAVWAAQDAESAVRWVQQLPDGEERNAAMLSAAGEINRDDPITALTLAVELPESQSRNEFIVHSASDWGAQSFKESVAWAGQISDEALRHQVIGAIASAAAESDPAAAATLAINSLPGGREQDDAVVGIVQRWVQNEPEQAAAWVATFPEGKLRETALDSVVKLWADRNLAEAGTWVNGFGSQASRDIAVAAYVGKVGLRYPETAIEWIQEIRNDQLRNEQMENLAELWLRADGVAARKWIADAPLSAAAKSRLLVLQPE